ncbi:hypothetical protein CONLIGDRAFT_640744 [Coniochaeta ligniaria NRRL 30616]|uniref:Apple domain-containing protein n=1 Tax=Coniochaeta ligniaria NRRL 30616 TaxID=1408157 RepID=A0A1J7JJT8_9PEZI|nr:hypothetical protein CONLIGDRAFT_640744 [Coniochaeta ligniaria NRRL 30616]
MDPKKGPGGGIELSHHHTTTNPGDRTSQPGLEAVDYSNLEVVVPPPRPDLSHAHADAARAWEKGGGGGGLLPQAYGHQHHHPGLPAQGTPYGGGGVVAPGYYEYMSPGSGGGSGGVLLAQDGGFFRQDAICGVKRQTFWIVMAVGIFVMVAAVAIGVGLGVALHKSDDGAPSATPLPSANSSSPTTTATSLPAPTATGATGPEVAISCPANNRTLYASSGKSYLLLCGRDYSSVDGAEDLFHEPMDSMSDCIDECPKQQGCVGVGWGPYQNVNTCWLKSKLGTPNVTPNWYFAVEDEGALGG